MPKATLMVRFKRPADPNWIRRPAVYGSAGRVRSGFAQFKDRTTGRIWVEEVPDNYAFDIRIEDGRTTYKPAGKNGADAEAQRVQAAAKFMPKRKRKQLASRSSIQQLRRKERRNPGWPTPSTTTSSTSSSAALSKPGNRRSWSRLNS